jgi:hypothetical protein
MNVRARPFRIAYWVLCAVLMVFAIRYMLHYRQTIEDAIHFNDKNYNDKK